MSHLRAADGSVLCDHTDDWEPELHLAESAEASSHEPHGDEHEHSHGLVDRSILRSRAGSRAVSWGLAILTITARAQAFIHMCGLGAA